MIQDLFDTVNETAAGGFQLLVADKNGTVQHWERRNDDTQLRPPEEGVQGKWGLVEITGAEVKRVWAHVQGSFWGEYI